MGTAATVILFVLLVMAAFEAWCARMAANDARAKIAEVQRKLDRMHDQLIALLIKSDIDPVTLDEPLDLPFKD